jgi:hypothetical protein
MRSYCTFAAHTTTFGITKQAIKGEPTALSVVKPYTILPEYLLSGFVIGCYPRTIHSFALITPESSMAFEPMECAAQVARRC